MEAVSMTYNNDDLDPGKLMRVGELARRCGKSVRALHLYEEMGLLQPDGRTKGGFRLYTPAAIQRVAWIGKLQDMGFSLTEAQVLLRDWSRVKTAPRAMARIKELFVRRLRQTQENIDRLTSLKGEIEESLGYMERCACCESASSEACGSCQHERAPMLLAQFSRPPTGEHVEISGRNPRRS